MKCPFRKHYNCGDWNLAGNGFPMVREWIEDFDECLGKNCMAHYIVEKGEGVVEYRCKLMD